MPTAALKQTTDLPKIKPQPGPQYDFLATKADIGIFGGAAGGGKTYGLLMECGRHVMVPNFYAVLFRREYTQITQPGGMWDSALSIYPGLGGQPRYGPLDWAFGNGAKIKFGHMQHEQDRYNWDGSQIAMIGFDQLESFTWRQFSYLLSRNRSTCGIKGYVRATCNPVHGDDPTGGWLRHLIAWWIDDDSGLAIPERSGVIRYFVNIDDEIVWADTPGELIKRYGADTLPKSCTFIHSNIYDNKILMDADPQYLASLKAMPLVDRSRLLGANWNVKEAAGMFFKRPWFEVVDAAPAGGQEIRYWDRAGTDAMDKNAGQASWTAGIKLQKHPSGVWYVVHCVRFQGSPLKVQEQVKNVASQDGTAVQVGIEGDPGQAGKAEAELQVRNLAGYDVRINTVRESKGTRAKPVSAQAEAGNVKLVKGDWVEAFLREAENFDGTDKCTSDQVDALSGAFMMLNNTVQIGVY